MAAAGLVLVLGVVLLLVPFHRRRRHRPPTPNQAVITAWAEAADALGAAGWARAPSETILAYAHRVAGDDRLPTSLTEPVLALAGRAGVASYSRGEVAPVDAEESERAAVAVRAGVRPLTPLRRRAVRALANHRFVGQ